MLWGWIEIIQMSYCFHYRNISLLLLLIPGYLRIVFFELLKTNITGFFKSIFNNILLLKFYFNAIMLILKLPNAEVFLKINLCSFHGCFFFDFKRLTFSDIALFAKAVTDIPVFSL